MFNKIFGFLKREKPKRKYTKRVKVEPKKQVISDRKKTVYLNKYQISSIRKMKRDEGLTAKQISDKTGFLPQTIQYHVKGVHVKTDAEYIEGIRKSHARKLPVFHDPLCVGCYPERGVNSNRAQAKKDG